MGQPSIISREDAPLILNELKTLNYEGQIFVTENDMACFDKLSSLSDALTFCGFTMRKTLDGAIITGWEQPNVSLMSPTISQLLHPLRAAAWT